ncbi:MAG TPA: LLM class flavin-dependent oxidoreductase [Candidatus Limnocylindria bacterium]|nr:LLM class flavin-dependent oxidoreductase [Candidatus Limnocylindria bacterium]
MTIEFGLLLPHFSDSTTWDRLFGFAPRAEELGYESLWARDNLSFHGHGFELPGDHFVDPFTTLAGVAARTERAKIGTAVLTPFRHPLITAQLVGGLDYLSKGRFVLGIGPGTPRKPWEALGRQHEERVVATKETVEVLRLVSSGEDVSYEGEQFSFTDVKIDPPPSPDMMVWYGGASNASIRAILDYCDGMLPGRCPFTRYDVAAERLKAGAAEIGKQVHLGSIPTVSIAPTRQEAIDKIPMQALLDTASERWKRPFEKPEDLAGAVVVGSPSDCIEQVQAFVDRGIELFVVDLRLLMNEFEEAAELFAAEVIPAFRSAS